MIFLQLFYTFFKIGLFGFGGGYAMLSMIQGEVVTRHDWLSSSEFTDIVAISQMTPGPIGINSATYVGYTAVVNAGYSHAIGILGSAIATCSVVLPSFILMIIISKFFLKYQKHPSVAAENFGTDTYGIVTSIIIFISVFIASHRYKANPILLIILCGAAGLMLY